MAKQLRGSSFGFITKVLKNATVEPILFLASFGLCNFYLIESDMYLSRACLVNLHFNDSICQHLPDYHEQEMEVQSVVTPIVTAKQYMQAMIAIFFSLFFGPWSDIHGRKLPLLFPIAAGIVSFSIYIMFTFWEVPIEYLLIASLPASVGGGMPISLAAAHSYISDISSTTNRTFRLSVLEFAWILARVLGLFSSGYLLKATGHSGVFTVSALAYSMALVYGVCVVKDTKSSSDGVLSPSTCCKSFFNSGLVVSTFRTTFRQRERYVRGQIVTVLMAVTLCDLGEGGYNAVLLFYTRNVLHWDTFDNTIYSTVQNFVAASGSTIAAYIFHSVLRVHDSLLCVVAVLFMMAHYLWVSFVTETWMMYANVTFAVLYYVPWVNGRALLSKLVTPKEVGAIIYTLGLLQNANNLIFPMYLLGYRAALDVLPSAPLFVSIGLLGSAAVLFSVVYYLEKISPLRSNTNDDGDDDGNVDVDVDVDVDFDVDVDVDELSHSKSDLIKETEMELNRSLRRVSFTH